MDIRSLKKSSKPYPSPKSSCGTTSPVYPSGSCPSKTSPGAGLSRRMSATEARRGCVGGDWISLGAVCRNERKRAWSSSPGASLGDSAGGSVCIIRREADVQRSGLARHDVEALLSRTISLHLSCREDDMCFSRSPRGSGAIKGSITV